MRWPSVSVARRRERNVKLEDAFGESDIQSEPSTPQRPGSFICSPDTLEDSHFASFSLPQPEIRIGQIPSDLLLIIWELAITSDIASHFHPTHDIPTLLKINFVCRHWRWLALNSPLLWTYIPTNLHPNLILLFLQRSSDALLHVNVKHEVVREWSVSRSNQGRPRSLSKLSMVVPIPHFHRVQFLSLSVSTFSLALTNIDSEVPHQCDLPRLEGMRFGVNGVLTKGRPSEVGRCIQAAVVSLLGKLRTPSIRELHLDGVDVPVDLIPTASLSRLSLTLRCAGSHVASYLEEVVKKCDSLVSLSLDIRNLEGAVDGSPSFQRISLPGLRQLLLTGSCNQCWAVRQMLVTPSLSEMSLSVGPSNCESATKFMPVAIRGNKASVKVGAGRISVTVSCMNTNDNDGVADFAGERQVFAFVIGYQELLFIRNNHRLLSLLQQRQFPDVTFVDFATQFVYKKEFSANLFAHFPNAKILRLHYKGTRSKFPIEDAIDLNVLRSTDGTLTSICSLILTGFDVMMPQASPFLIELSSIVRQRRNSSCTPFVLEFRKCNGVTDSLLRTFYVSTRCLALSRPSRFIPRQHTQALQLYFLPPHSEPIETLLLSRQMNAPVQCKTCGKVGANVDSMKHCVCKRDDAVYCDTTCQIADRKNHKKECRKAYQALKKAAKASESKVSKSLDGAHSTQLVEAVDLLPHSNIPFVPEEVDIGSNHEIFSGGGYLSPVSKLIGLPILIYRHLHDHPQDYFHHSMKQQYDNQAATYLMIDPKTGFAPPEWQSGVGRVTVARLDKTPLCKEDLGNLWMYCDHILDYFSANGRPPKHYYTPSAFQRWVG
ncbi:hypothetical protein SCHPADRAFT_937749 [Schizopora paradoxa]|uniref:MYND-type domain-containing protein n=1 Tax=Schizopora paradoxa TaxID=27342 RepID=A0A0H2RY53_9AGAM|nr:hypothetical protein SCHPADRAFT_937749 [Schizopora paradoxa]